MLVSVRLPGRKVISLHLFVRKFLKMAGGRVSRRDSNEQGQRFVLSEADSKKIESINNSLGLNIDQSSISSIISGLLGIVVKMVDSKEDNWQTVTSEAAKKVTKRLSQAEDQIDAISQRQRKGCFLIHSPNNPNKKLTSILPKVDPDSPSYLEEVRSLVKVHYDVDIPKCDISACHPTGQGVALLKIANRAPGSAYFKLCAAVETGGVFGKHKRAKRRGEKSKEEGTSPPNLFITYQLTKRRANIVKVLKTLKHENRLFSFYTSKNGDIAARKTQGGETIFLTYCWNIENSKSYSEKEIHDLFK